MTHREQPITVWGVHHLGLVTLTCDMGETHQRKVVPTKTLGPVTGKALAQYGYGPAHDLMTDLRTDAQGRTYHLRPPFDFGGRAMWSREDGLGFYAHRPHGVLTLREALDLTARTGATIAWRDQPPVPGRKGPLPTGRVPAGHRVLPR